MENSAIAVKIKDREKNFGSSVNHSVYTERVRNNLEQLRGKYINLPQVVTRRETSDPPCDHFDEDYAAFSRQQKQGKERKPLGMLIMNKFKSRKLETHS